VAKRLTVAEADACESATGGRPVRAPSLYGMMIHDCCGWYVGLFFEKAYPLVN